MILQIAAGIIIGHAVIGLFVLGIAAYTRDEERAGTYLIIASLISAAVILIAAVAA